MWERRLQGIGQRLLVVETALQRGERKAVVSAVGGLAALTLAVLLLPLYSIVCLALRTAYIVVLVQVTLVVPIGRRFPFFLPGIKRRVVNLLLAVFMSVRTRVASRLASIVPTEISRGDVSETVSAEEWLKMGREIGKRIVVRRGELVCPLWEASECMYHLVSGEINIRSEALGSDVTVGPPTTLLQGNALIGHGWVGGWGGVAGSFSHEFFFC